MPKETLTWSGYRPVVPPAGCLVAHLVVNPITWPGYVVTVWLSMTSRPLWWGLPLFLPHALLLFAAVTAAVASRFAADTAEFAADRVVLRGESNARTVAVTDLRSVAVEHHGVVGEGYTQTRLELRWSTRGGAAGMGIIGPHDPGLASSLTELLGHRVRETWVDLHDAPWPGPP
ncbi:hypothetical protein [Streptomyces sp. MP131-18]|uniref:hypothetical protein n=1 Tax=Streptomyces sp. MP131-18 TaxID=1857892 RepID=UPI0009C70EB7|nr:hypothetical protein [Streptomyces sp. MP131-18]ONK16103.1 hypothetical protein STBA_69530 [Streptomyces sp. MP131-18]